MSEVIKKAKMSEDERELTDQPGEEEEEQVTPAPTFVTQYHVVKTIMENLPLRDLLQASKVNKQWNEIGKVVRKQRRSYPYTILYHPYLPHHKEAFEYFNGFDVSEEAKLLVQSGNNGYYAYKPKSYPRQLFPDLGKNAKETIRKEMMEKWDEPQLVIGFGTKSIDAHLTIEGAKKSMERMKNVYGGIQKDIPCLTAMSCGVVAALPGYCKSLEMENLKFPCMSFMAVPKAQGLRMKSFTVTKSQALQLQKKRNATTAEQCKVLLGIEEESKLKGIILLSDISLRRLPIMEMIQNYLKVNPTVVLAGGLHEAALASGIQDDTITTTGVLIYGDDSTNVSTVALVETKPERLRQKLEELKSALIPGGSSLAFMFICNGRGLHMHGRPHLESELFHSVFPKTPVIGSYTYGELFHGADILNEEKKFEPPRRIEYSYATVILLVSFKHGEGSGQEAQ